MQGQKSPFCWEKNALHTKTQNVQCRGPFRYQAFLRTCLQIEGNHNLWVKVADKRATTNLKYYFEVFFIPKKCPFEIFLLWMKSYFEVFIVLIKMLFRDILSATPIEKMEVNDWGAQNFPGPRQSSPTSQSTQIISNHCHSDSEEQNCNRKYRFLILQQIVANWTKL